MAWAWLRVGGIFPRRKPFYTNSAGGTGVCCGPCVYSMQSVSDVAHMCGIGTLRGCYAVYVVRCMFGMSGVCACVHVCVTCDMHCGVCHTCDG